MWPFQPSIEALKRRKNTKALLILLNKATKNPADHASAESTANAVIKAIGEIGDPTVAQPLLDFFRGFSIFDKGVCRDSAADAIAELGTSIVPTLIDALGDADFRVSDTASSALGKIGAPAEQSLIEAYSKAGRRTRICIMYLLGARASDNGNRCLIRAAAEDKDKDVRIAAITNLETQGAAEALAAVFGNKTIPKDAREKAQYALSNMATDASDYVMPLLQDNRFDQRGHAAWILGNQARTGALGHGSTRKVIDAFVELLQGKDVGEEKDFILEALIKVARPAGDVESLILALRMASRFRERYDATKALAECWGEVRREEAITRRAVGVLHQVLKGEDDWHGDMKTAARDALQRIGIAVTDTPR